MSNWRERAEAVLVRQKASEEAQGIENNRLEEIGKIRIAELDVALEIPQKLADINRDILKGLGKISVGRTIVHPTRALRIGISLDFFHKGTITETVVGVSERKYGKHKVAHYYLSGGPNDAGYYTKYTEEVGWYDDPVGDRLTGYVHEYATKESVEIGYGSSPEDGSTSIFISDSLAKLEQSDINIPVSDGWKMTLNHREGKSEIEVSFPYQQVDTVAMGTFVDAILLQASVARLPYVDTLLRDDAKIREIQSRIGQVIPVK